MGLREAFLLDEGVVHLNHGSFGACPRPVFDAYQHWQRELERNPTGFFGRRLDGLLDGVRAALAGVLGADAEGVLLVTNATVAVNTVAASLELGPGDEVLSTDHEYGAMDLVWSHACARAGARHVRRAVPVPCASATELAEAVWSGVTERTRVLFLSHVTSPTALTLPVGELCARARSAGVLTVVDGAHAPGQLELDLEAIGADFYAGNCHKWLCAPKGAGFLAVRPEHRARLRPHVVSWGADSPTFAERHGWQGTRDPAAFLAVPDALEFHREHLAARSAGCHALLGEFRPLLGAPLTPDGPEWFRQMASVQLPDCDPDDVRRRLHDEHRIEVAVHAWQRRPLLRVSVQAYNTRDDLQRLYEALPEVLARAASR